MQYSSTVRISNSILRQHGILSLTSASVLTKRTRVITKQLSSLNETNTNRNRNSNNRRTEKYSKKVKKSQEPIYIREGLFSVIKPMNWTSSNTVEYVRRIFELDARRRGVQGKNRQLLKVGRIPPILKVGHGGTLDPLASGVLVIGIGSGTKQLKHYLKGNKRYIIRVKLGIETTTLDMDGDVTKIVPFGHITKDMIEYVLPSFVGDAIEQIPPLYSAIKLNGKSLHQLARDDNTNDNHIVIPSRHVTINSIHLISFEKGDDEEDDDANQLNMNVDGQQRPRQYPQSKPTFFELDVECGGGTYMRSLARDIALKLGTVATCASITRVKQGPFIIDDSLHKENNGWNMDTFITSMDRCKDKYHL